MVAPNERRPWRLAASVLVAVSWVLLAPASALAHGDEGDVPAVTSVQEAIAIIRSQPELTDAITDKVGDALESNDTEGVDLSKVEQAQSALMDGDLTQTELLLEEAVGACPGQPVVVPAEIRTAPAAGSPCPRPTHLTALSRVPIGGPQRPLLLGFAVLAIGGGAFLVRRTHEHVTR